MPIPPEKLIVHETRSVPIERLKPAEYNPRTITDAALAALTASIARFGFLEPIVWNETSGNVVGGHQRLKVLIASGAIVAPVTVVHLDPIEEKALNIALNSPTLQGTFTPALDGILSELEATFPDCDALAFGDLEPPFEPTPANEPTDPAKPGRPTSRAGDLWLLGPHHVLCGDTDHDDCDGIVERWQLATSQSAMLQGDGRTYAQIKEARATEST